MDFGQESAEIFVPDGAPLGEALGRTTHMGVGAHPDDLEILACHGILKCFHHADKSFCGVVMTDGAGAPRSGPYAGYSDAEMVALRRAEQKKAAVVGGYGAQVMLDYPSSAVKDPDDHSPVRDLMGIIDAARPEAVYTHNPADRHETHVATVLRVIEAIRRLPAEARPELVYGCEVWGALDWLPEEETVALDVSGHENLQWALLGVFDSQISGGKRYDLATMGRRRANATYHASHEVDAASGMIFAMDLTPLVLDDGLDVGGYVEGLIEGFAQGVAERIKTVGV
jgi:LmbE family N-acetylglucosaminyl deacetylase